MTRYELFEAWLTPKEWATWKHYSLIRFMRVNNLTYGEAKDRRKAFLHDPINIDVSRRVVVNSEWDIMTNTYLRWAETPQGHSYWSSVNSRTAPVRVLPRMTIVINNTTN